MRLEIYKTDEGTELRIPVPESYADCLELIRSDRYRISGKREPLWRILAEVLRPFRSSVLFWLRLSSYRGGMHLLCRYMYRRAARKACIQISPESHIGYGLFIGHAVGMVVNRGTVIGNNVNLSQFLNIGTNRKTPAVICDNVYLGPMVCLIEDVVIGRNSTVGAGSVVTRSVPENATVVGSPAKILNYNAPGRFVCNRYPVPGDEV